MFFFLFLSIIVVLNRLNTSFIKDAYQLSKIK